MRAATMAPARVALANAAIFAIIGGSLAALALDKELWPFSQYPMYTRINQEYVLINYEVRGVTPFAVELSMPPQLVSPLSFTRWAAALRRLHQEPGRGEDIRRAMRYVWDRYHARPGAVPLEALRVYRVRRELPRDRFDPEAPVERELLTEYRP